MDRSSNATHIHGVEIEDRVPDQLPRTVVCHLPASFRDVELGADILHLLLLGMKRIGVLRVVPPSCGIRRDMLCPVSCQNAGRRGLRDRLRLTKQ
jgi:hypothetical protein